MKIRYVITTVFLLLTCFSIFAYTPDIHISHGKYNDYYHMRFVLTPENCELTVPLSERFPKYDKTNEYSFSDGGQFEVFIRKSQFPVSAPHTNRDYLILRMPWTNPALPDSNQHIAVKRQLFEKIRKMKGDNKGSVEVVVELNPYVSVLEKQPLSLELTGRNIFFRHAHGGYIDYIGPLVPVLEE
jgi:hypothetical protein